MATFLTAEEVLTIAENKQSAAIGTTYISDLADFRHAVRHAATGAVLHIAGCMAQTDHYSCVAQLTDGTRLYEAHVHPGIDANEWSAIVD
jgi:TPP-dependent indolepyruvate ferredoxin oxidoreductase alpha subunit